MKMVCLFLIVLFCSCNKSSKENSPEEVKVIDSLPTNGVIDSSKLKKVIYYNHQTNAGSYYDEDGYKAFKKWFDDLNKNYIHHPDDAQLLFVERDIYKQTSNPINKVAVGPDFFYLYAHFTQRKNGIYVHSDMRKKLLKIFGLINAIHRNIHFDGGIYFAAQRTAIAAYAEYAIYNYVMYNEIIYDKKYSIEKQKDLYVQLLKQKIEDELNAYEKVKGNQYSYLETTEERKEYKKQTLSYVDELEELIETHHDLKIAQEFQYKYYE
tara:strand:+ start:39457 stop:40254 length:798 start_codon:yes stop_codon:yes gene_type:complete